MRRQTSLVALLLLLTSTALVHGRGLDDEQVGQFQAATAALGKGATTEAIQQFELMADRGVSHPDVSFNRAVAYARRARSAQARPGDLGRAVFALSEALELRPEDAETKALLQHVEHELSRTRSRRGNPSLLARPRLTRAVVELLPENVWAISALLCSLATTLGILLRFGRSQPRRRLAGAVTAGLGAALLLVSSAGLSYAVHQRTTTRQGIVVADNARLLDIAGAPMPASRGNGEDLTIPEGARVVVTGRTERLLKVEWGSLVAYLSPIELQLLPSTR